MLLIASHDLSKSRAPQCKAMETQIICYDCARSRKIQIYESPTWTS